VLLLTQAVPTLPRRAHHSLGARYLAPTYPDDDDEDEDDEEITSMRRSRAALTIGSAVLVLGLIPATTQVRDLIAALKDRYPRRPVFVVGDFNRRRAVHLPGVTYVPRGNLGEDHRSELTFPDRLCPIRSSFAPNGRSCARGARRIAPRSQR